MSDCVFCRIVEGSLPSAKLYEDDLTIAFMDAGQVNPGHVIIAVKPHRETILDLSDELAAAAFVTATRIARAVQQALSPDGITVLQANRPAGWQTVPHFHLHVLPRHHGDAAGLTWPRRNPPFEELQALAERIRPAL